MTLFSKMKGMLGQMFCVKSQKKYNTLERTRFSLLCQAIFLLFFFHIRLNDRILSKRMLFGYKMPEKSPKVNLVQDLISGPCLFLHSSFQNLILFMHISRPRSVSLFLLGGPIYQNNVENLNLPISKPFSRFFLVLFPGH